MASSPERQCGGAVGPCSAGGCCHCRATKPFTVLAGVGRSGHPSAPSSSPRFKGGLNSPLSVTLAAGR